MSQERRVPTPLRPRRPGSGSGPTARRRAIHASDPAPGDDFDEVGHNTAVLLTQAANVDNALHLEWAISRFLPCWGDEPARFDMDYIEATTLAIVGELEGTGDATALVVLRGLEALASGVLPEASAAAADRLAAEGVTAPPWSWQIGQAAAVDARVMRNDDDASLGVMVEFAYPDGGRHALAAFIADDMGGAVKLMGLTKALDEACPEHDDAIPLRPISPQAGIDLIRDALEATDQVHARFEGDPSMREFGALAWSRVRG